MYADFVTANEDTFFQLIKKDSKYTKYPFVIKHLNYYF